MSLIGRRKLIIPENVTVNVDSKFREIEIIGPKGRLIKKLSGAIVIKIVDSILTTNPLPNIPRQVKPMWGTTNSLISGWIIGVVSGFKKKLLINGLGYKAILKDKILELHLGFSHTINFKIPAEITIKTPTTTEIEISGIDKALVGLTASQIRKFKKVEPYKGKGVYYHDEKPLRKAGKTATTAK